MGSVTTDSSEECTVCRTHPLQQSWLVTSLGKVMNVNSGCNLK